MSEIYILTVVISFLVSTFCFIKSYLLKRKSGDKLDGADILWICGFYLIIMWLPMGNLLSTLMSCLFYHLLAVNKC